MTDAVLPASDQLTVKDHGHDSIQAVVKTFCQPGRSKGLRSSNVPQARFAGGVEKEKIHRV